MDFAVRHFMPGRLRLHVPQICRNKKLAGSFQTWLSAQKGIKAVRINFNCSSIVIEYDSAYQSFLQDVLKQFQRLSADDLRAVLAFAQATSPGNEGHENFAKPPPSVPKRIPLALPSLSLLLALSGNPIIFAINLPLIFWNSIPIGMRAYKVWHNESRLNVDFLDVLAISASLAQANPLAGSIIVWLVKLGDWIRDLTAAGSRRAIAELLEFQSKTAWVVRDGEVVSVPAKSLAVEDIVVVYPGEVIPVDGEIVEGSATIDQKTITGEGLPVVRGKGEAAFAATVIREGQLRIRALRVGDGTTAGQIAHLVESAPIGDTRMQNHAERFADRLVLPTLALATGTAAVTADFTRFLNLVIVDYGTGVRVSAPTSMLASMTHAARVGIITKSGAHIERLAEADTVVFDKTGTLTHGSPAVIDVIPYSNHLSAGQLLGLAAAAETKLQHPVAEALRAKAADLGVAVPPCDETTYRLGLGVEGDVGGFYVHVGNKRFMRQSGISTDISNSDRSALDERGYSVLYIAVDGMLAGLIPYSDKIRPESKQVIAKLHAMGIKNTIMLTGDNDVVARAVCKQIGLTRHFADMLPGDKADVIQTLQKEGKIVAMVGDGINDSPALSFADIGIAMKHGAEVAHESANIVLMEDSLWKLVKAVEISRDAVGLIKQNYFIVGAMNTAALALALPGNLVTPEITALISNGSAILASLNGARPTLRYK
jgi:heavy metal translocating P-type ATPase